MHTVHQISLSGHPLMFRLNEDAYTRLRQYLERAGQRLHADPDQAEVLGDLEQAIGEKLAARLGAPDHVLSAAEVEAVLAEVGPVDTGRPEPSPAPEQPPARRRLVRILEGKQIAGVCQGLAAYSNITVDWVQTIFILLSLATGGVFGLLYLVLAFWLPAVATHADYARLTAAPTAS